ncbi:MAG: CHAP domain-containing protein [Spirochaetota bacterium]
MRKLHCLLFLACVPILLFSCLTFSVASINPKTVKKGAAAKSEAGEIGLSIQQKLVEGAGKVLGAKSLIIRGKPFAMDCTGTVLAIYYYAGIDLATPLKRYSGNGVARLYRYLANKNLLYSTTDPTPGDIIFWDNTYDMNKDGYFNDQLTHMGMVIRAGQWGTIDYVHLNYSRGIVIERMNLKESDVNRKKINGEWVIINSPLRMKGEPKTERWLASHLYKNFGKGYLLENRP